METRPPCLVITSTDATVMAPTAVDTSARKGPSVPLLPAALTTSTPFAMALAITRWYMSLSSYPDPEASERLMMSHPSRTARSMASTSTLSPA